ncbi:hypothetical protein AOL_s00173g333 [Orbilia oligospora ATCC 24927]|uniref:F-box domain-containing protein n=2 Tax=Orbilia oligospora TaxID=2813651 RepID=G1XPG5_ARTOA|nr:hypothetical protein AOL_s00173g333 [Orbilia oligospora ATCC 24927]EGX45232.1 hypothetical protein AOL_s00173g333 [Orbilia oligospora ATCC 24927]KAF3286953.1 hypothetical protein TWF970_008783 [Orbilia oligospora]
MVNLMSLPMEMLLEVSSHLDESSKSRLSQTCKYLHDTVTPEVYRDLTVNMFYHPSAANDVKSLSITPSKEKGGRRAESPLHALDDYGGYVRTLTVRTSRMPKEWTKTQARKSRVSMRWLKEAILKCTGLRTIRLESGSGVDSAELPEAIYQPYEMFYSFLGIAETVALSLNHLEEMVISGLSDVDSFKEHLIAVGGPCDLTLSALSTIRFKVQERNFGERISRWRQISDALNGIGTTIQVGNIDPASRRRRDAHPDLPQLDCWERMVKRVNCTMDAISPDLTLCFDTEDVRSLNLLSLPTDKSSYREVIPRTTRFRKLKQLWIAQYQPGSGSPIPWEETFPGLFKSLPNLEGITYRQFFRDSDRRHKNEWRMVETRYKPDRIEGTVARHGSVRDEFYNI